MSAEFEIATPEAMRELGERLSSVLRAGDLVVLNGALGAGKTTLAQGIGRGLGVRGAVTSPTFVIARAHPSLTEGPALLHADAYRLEGWLEVDDLDLDASLAESVTLVEWGHGLVEGLSPDRLEIDIMRAVGLDGDVRHVRISPYGTRWDAEQLADLLAPR
jgi:tRNA threonylcarbamoyladenosine biosynthesis protein TsaE